MAQLIVRKLEPAIVAGLRRRAAAAGRSVEAEHREILRHAVAPEASATPLLEMLLSMPAAGRDAAFKRNRRRARRIRL